MLVPNGREIANVLIEHPNAFALLGDRIFINLGKSAEWTSCDFVALIFLDSL